MRYFVFLALGGLTVGAYGVEFLVELLPDTVPFGVSTPTYNDLSNSGRTIGVVYTGQDRGYSTFLYDQGCFTEHRIPGANHTEATALNARGDFIGLADIPIEGGLHGFLYQHGRYHLLRYQNRAMQPGAINDLGDHAGILRSEGNYVPYAIIDGRWHLLPFTPDMLVSQVYALTNSGLLVGGFGYYSSPTTRAYSWTPEGGLQVRPILTWLTDANDLGEIVGYRQVVGGDQRWPTYRGLVERNGETIDLGAGFTMLINNRSEMVHYENHLAYLIRGSERTLLLSMIDQALDIKRLEPKVLNDRGQMLASIRIGANTWRQAILTPVPEPSTLLALGGMSTLLLMRRRRRAQSGPPTLGQR